MAFVNLSPRQKNRAALQRDVRSICNETCHLLGLDITKPSTDIIAELVYKKLLLYGSDLEAFARHSKRSTISADDVKLLVRRNPSLKEHLGSLSNNTTAKKQRRKTTNRTEAGTEKTVEPRRNLDNETTAKVDREMETDYLEIFTNNQTGNENRKTVNTEIKDSTQKAMELLKDEARENDEMEVNETIDLTFD